MKRDEKLIRELEKEILETNACISEVQAKVWRLPDSDPARAGANALIGRLVEARTVAFNSLTTLVQGVELRPVRH
jgi:hypothetical protein